MQGAGGDRLLSLEGLRGIAAIVVVIFHGLSMYYPLMLYGMASGTGLIQNAAIEDNIYGNPASVFISGTFAVALFFVLSGFVLSVSFFSTGVPEKITKIASKRYIRLMLPALASVMLTFLVITFGFDWLKSDTAAITGSLWLDGLWPKTVSIVDAFSQGAWNAFFSDINSSIAYNPVLWTMRYELLGSLLVFVLALIFGKSSRRWAIYIIAIVATFQTWYLAFIIGMILADLYSLKKFPFHDTKGKWGWLLLTMLTGLFLGGYAYTSKEDTIYAALNLPLMTDSQNYSFYLSIGTALVLVAVIGIKPVSKLLGSRYISALGKYSFSIYLTHLAVLLTIGAGTFLLLHNSAGFHLAAAISIIVSLLVTAPVAYLFERFIDTPSIRLSGLFYEWLFKDKKS